jgi:hypothetical protein
MGFIVRRLVAPVLARLGSRTILTVGGTLFALNLLIPDPLPLVDELLILAGTVLLSRWASTLTSPERKPDGWATTPPGEPKHVGRGSTQPRS